MLALPWAERSLLTPLGLRPPSSREDPPQSVSPPPTLYPVTQGRAESGQLSLSSELYPHTPTGRMSPKAEMNISRQPGLDGQVWDTHPMLPLASLPLGMDRAPGLGSAPRDHRPVRARWAQEKPSLAPGRKIAADPGQEGMAQSGGLMAPSILLSLLLKPLTCKALFAPVILHLPSTVPSLAGCFPSSPRPFFVSPHGVLEQPFPQPSLLWLTPRR